MKLDNNKSIEQTLKDEARRFLKILQEEINRFYASYDPTLYQRTFKSARSIFVDDFVRVDYSTNSMSIKIKFNENAFHDSLFSNDTVNVLYLLNDGYKVQKDTWFKDIEYFGYRSGYHFFENAIERFNKKNPLGIDIKLERSG